MPVRGSILPTMTTPDFTATVSEARRIVAGVRDDQLAGPTPCAATSVAGLLDHLVGLTAAFLAAAGKRSMGAPPVASAEALPPDWRTVVPRQLDELETAWADPAAWEGTAEAGGVQLPASAMGMFALNEVLVHGWDVAAATGQEYRPDPVATQLCLTFAVDVEATSPDVRDGMYGPRVPVPGDAPQFERLLGQTGRDPRWAGLGVR